MRHLIIVFLFFSHCLCAQVPVSSTKYTNNADVLAKNHVSSVSYKHSFSIVSKQQILSSKSWIFLKEMTDSLGRIYAETQYDSLGNPYITSRYYYHGDSPLIDSIYTYNEQTRQTFRQKAYEKDGKTIWCAKIERGPYSMVYEVEGFPNGLRKKAVHTLHRKQKGRSFDEVDTIELIYTFR